MRRPFIYVPLPQRSSRLCDSEHCHELRIGPHGRSADNGTSGAKLLHLGMLHDGGLVVPGGCLVLSIGLQPTDVFTPPEAPLRITETFAVSTDYMIYN